MTTTDRIVVGAFGGAFGVKGEVRIKSFCADPAAISDYAPLYSADGRAFATVVVTGYASNALTARVDGVITKEDADALKGQEIFADRGRLPSLPDDEYYYSDLIGLTVVDTGGTEIGRVKAVLNHGASDLLEVTKSEGSGNILLPFTRAVVPTVDLTARRIVADPPEGLD